MTLSRISFVHECAPPAGDAILVGRATTRPRHHHAVTFYGSGRRGQPDDICARVVPLTGRRCPLRHHLPTHLRGNAVDECRELPLPTFIDSPWGRSKTLTPVSYHASLSVLTYRIRWREVIIELFVLLITIKQPL